MQIYHIADGEETVFFTVFFWKGTKPGALPKAADAVRVARQYAKLPGDLTAQLEIDRMGTLHQHDGPGQLAGLRFLRSRGAPDAQP